MSCEANLVWLVLCVSLFMHKTKASIYKLSESMIMSPGVIITSVIIIKSTHSCSSWPNEKNYSSLFWKTKVWKQL